MKGCLCAALLLAGALPFGPLAVAADDVPVPLARVALGDIGGWITLEVVTDGRPGRWLLDTGASRNLVGAAFAQRLGLVPRGRVRADTLLGPVYGGEVDLPSLRIGSLERAGQSALVVGLESLFGAAADGVDGVIGVPWLEGVQMELDLRGWVSHWRMGGELACPSGLTAQPLQRHRGLPVLAVDAAGERGTFVLDTGNPAALVRIEATAASAATPGIALPGGMRMAVAPRVTIGPQTRSDVPVLRLPAPALKAILGDGLSGLAGTALLDGARWRLDLARDQLCVEAGRFATPGGFGLTLARDGAGLRLDLVLPGGPAELAGLRSGDRVTEWPGGSAERPLHQLWAAVVDVQDIIVGVGDPARRVSLRRSVFAPPLTP